MTPRLVRQLAFAAAVLASFTGRALPENTWLIAIGNNQGAATEVSLLYAERDAREMADAFRQHSGVSSRRMTLLMNENAETLRKTLLDVNTAIRDRASHSDTALIVYYSGHADAASLHLGGTEFPFDELKALVESSPAGLRFLILDACRSGTVTRVKGVRQAESFRINVRSEIAPEGVAIITSSAADEFSQESDAMHGSFFTHHFINALRGAADRNGDGQITLSEAFDYAHAQTLRSSGQTFSLQHPTYYWNFKGRAEPVLSTPADMQGRMGRLRFVEGSTYLIMEKRDGGPLVADVSPQSDRSEMVLPAADYFVQQRNRTEFREYQVKLPAGGVVDLAKVPYRSVSYDRLVRRRGSLQTHTHSLMILGGAEGTMLAGESAVPQLQIGYGLDFDWGSLGLRLMGATITSNSGQSDLPQRHDQLGLGLTLQRFVDFRDFSAAFGLLIAADYHHQSFDSPRDTPSTNSFGGAFGGIFSLERHLGEGFAVRLEGGPITGVFREGVIQNGVQTGSTIATPFTWWAGGGLVWRH